MSQINHCLVFKLPFDGLKVGLMCYLPNCPHNLGRVGLGFQPEPSRCPVPKTQEPLRVFVVADGLARQVSFRVVGLGVGASAPGRKDGHEVPWRPPGAEAVAVIGPVRDQAGGTRRSRLPPGPGPGGCRGVGRPSRADAGDSPVDPPGYGFGCRSHPGCDPVRVPPLCAWVRPPRSRARARPCCPAARRTDPAGLADGPAGAARRPGGARLPNGHRPSSPFRTRAATRAQVRPSVPSRAALPRQDGHARPCLRVGRNR